MKISYYFLVFYLISLFGHLAVNCSMQPAVLCHDYERSALLQFKDSLIVDTFASSDPSAYPKVASWNLTAEENSSSDCCSWDGVKCNQETGHIITLDLTSSCLYGSIDSTSTLFHLVHLQWLSLADNYFNYSTIPSTIINLSSLSHLNLAQSVFFGQIPLELLELYNLMSLNLSNNYLEFQGPGLTSLFDKLTNLKVLDLTGCGMQGTIPSSICNLSELVHLGLAGNFFTGELPTFIGCLGSLKVLDLFKCSFLGPVPYSLHNLTHLNFLDLSHNDFLGQNPSSFSWIANNPKLTYLGLENINLTGEIPSWLMNLTRLSDLIMADNHLTGEIPSWIFNMNQLSNLNFILNRLTGEIPSQIGNLTGLKFLRLGGNKFRGPIPSSIFELENLEWLTLTANNLSGKFELGMFLHKLKHLEVLGLSSNNLSLLTNSRTPNNTNLKKLWFVGLGSCNLTQFPNFLQNLDRLYELDLSSNKISGQIPRWLLHIGTNRLHLLNLSNNFLTGFDQSPVVLPWTNLLSLDLRSNKLRGPLPIPSLSTIHYLVSNNYLSGEIPLWICNLQYLHILDLSNNELSGVLPRCLGNLSYLSVLDLQSNKIQGSIPENFMNGTDLRMMDLSNNKLRGRIPRSLATYRMVEFLNLGNNEITDLFPAWLGTLPELQVLILRSNKLHGIIGEPESDFEFPKLRIVDLSYNRFTGKLPSKYFQCWNAMKVVGVNDLTYLHYALMPTKYYSLRKNESGYGYSLTVTIKGVNMKYEKISNLFTGILLSNNKFTGEIPASIASLKVLQALNLSHNDLGGHIPSSLSNLTTLESLDLSYNKLSGEIPQQLAALTFLEVLTVSHNNLVGLIPHGNQFDTFDNSSFDGNLGLCGKPLSRKCENSKAEAPQKEDEDTKSPFVMGWKIALIGYAGGLIVGLVLGQEFYLRKHEWFVKIFGERIKRIKRQRGRRN